MIDKLNWDQSKIPRNSIQYSKAELDSSKHLHFPLKIDFELLNVMT